MKVSTKTKKTIAAAALVLPLALSACGSDESETKTASDATEATASKAADSSKAKSSETKESTESTESATSEEKPEGEDKDKPADPNTPPGENLGPQGDPNTVENPFNNGQAPIADIQPLQSGVEGSPEVTAEIRAVIDDLYAQNTLKGMTDAMLNNTCARVIDENGGPQAFDTGSMPDMSFAELGIDTSQNYVENVSDVKVDGNRASATVSVHTKDGPSHATQIFEHENGSWKMCN
ncbi:hypothetical protein QP027_07295 [Corynebacterium breve]|uniref:Secreted protein n=1 Tax=Corynebacterium breve TaxID=3049799 RepID=A0ABY8VE86_9CORY|nr:hypothetical protein [Corynebacterium breve]WIM66938.1 hypothetical protein QP027_07295 [Corynebacterium breve]